MDKRIKITFIEDFHGAKEFYSWQIRQLKKIKPQAVCLEMLPCEVRFTKLCDKLSKGDISPDEFRKRTRWEEHWGTFEGYDLLFKYLCGSKVLVYPVDQKLEERESLARREKKIIRDFQAGKDVELLIDQSRVELFLIREAIFAQNILELAKSEKLKKLAVLVGGNHLDRLSHFFNYLDEFEADKKRITKKKKEEIYPLFRQTHLDFAQKRKVLKMKNPPLVPINVLRSAELSKKKPSR